MQIEGLREREDGWMMEERRWIEGGSKDEGRKKVEGVA